MFFLIMKFSCYSQWEQLPGSADALFAQAENESFFFSRPWFESVSSVALEDDQSLLLVCVLEDDRLLALLPLVKVPGKTLFALKHRYTSLYGLLLDRTLPGGEQAQVFEYLAKGLSQQAIDGVILEPVEKHDTNMECFQSAMQVAGFQCEMLFRFYNWVYHVDGQTFAQYMAARPARLRNTIARKSRKLQREHGYETRLYVGDQVPTAMADYYSVYSASWKANEQYMHFVDDMVARFSKAGWTRLAVLYVKDQAVAAQLWFVVNDRASIFRLSYNEAWKSYSPGSILTAFLAEYVIDKDKAREIDFLTGNEMYKQDWMSERRERYALSCVKTVKARNGFGLFIQSLKRIFKNR